MATINPRLIPLIETLISAGADWLAIELIEALSYGLWPEESEEVLALTRAKVRNGVEEKREEETVHEVAASSEIPLDKQVSWAATFLLDRLNSAIADLGSGLANLDALMQNERPAGAKVDLQKIRPFAIHYGEGDDAVHVTASDIEKASFNMAGLKTALERWAREDDGFPA